MISMAKNMYKCKHTRHGKTAENCLDIFANPSIIDGNQHNTTHPLAYDAGGLGPNHNILSHDAAMKSVDSDKFEIFMIEEFGKIWENKIYEIIKKKDVREGHTILRSVWSHRLKTTSYGNLYRHRSRLCAD